VRFPLTIVYIVFVLIVWPWADSRQQDYTRAFPGAFLRGSANWTSLAAGLVAETPDDGKDLEYTSLLVCLKLADGQIG
jgi:hypothetical protein